MLSNELLEATLALNSRLETARRRFHAGDSFDSRRDDQNAMRVAAEQLYDALIAAGHSVRFSRGMLSNRGVEPTHPIFFDDFSAIEDLIRFATALKMNESASQ